ncbi:NUDIX hydrolase [Streptacidiphilus pinicola]|uniref:NUDIX hydrolase n=1 Tax=Streptacidiphilus pinicola TaxID=2219663 RepID=A0A2X0IET9_9ACTN|nr:NUDIX hydrolase [Streptacidiphilus pinicola]RAG83037.1 NUDIX hydrolase [Streptacidiphilus pinicola]
MESRTGTDAYEALRRDHPELFRNDPGGIEILHGPEGAAAVATLAGGFGVVYADRFVTVVRDPVRFPGGALGGYLRVVHAGTPGAVVLPLLGGEGPTRVVLLEHYRHATRAWHLEAPRGVGEVGETSAACAARELREELGAEVRELLPIGPLHADTGLIGGRVELFAARIDAWGRLEEEEGIRRAVVLGFDEAEDLVRDGRITDSFTVAALYRARLRGLPQRA